MPESLVHSKLRSSVLHTSLNDIQENPEEIMRLWKLTLSEHTWNVYLEIYTIFIQNRGHNKKICISLLFGFSTCICTVTLLLNGNSDSVLWSLGLHLIRFWEFREFLYTRHSVRQLAQSKCSKEWSSQRIKNSDSNTCTWTVIAAVFTVAKK